jgi:hypothetical protein
MSVDINSEIAREILSFALEGKVWPTGRKYVASEWVDTSGHIEAEDWEHEEPLPEDWAPNIPPENILHSDDLCLALHQAAMVDPSTGLPRSENLTLPIEDMHITGAVRCLSDRFPFPIRFRNCIFTECIDFKDSQIRLLHLKRCRAPFISLKRAQIDQSVVIEHSVLTDGLNLRGATINGLLGLKHTRLTDGDNKFRALDLRYAHIGSNVFLRRGFLSNGLVDMSSATIDGGLDCGDGNFLCKGDGVTKKPVALRAKAARFGGTVFLNWGFKSIGEVDFRRAQIGAQMTVRNASLVQDKPGNLVRPYFALNLENAVIAQDLMLGELRALKGDIGLQYATAKNFTDRPEERLKNSKRYKGKIWLSGFKYDSITRTHGDVKTRVKWLRAVLPKHYLNKYFVRQPWEHLATVLKLNGEYSASDELFIEAEKRGIKQLLPNGLWRTVIFLLLLSALLLPLSNSLLLLRIAFGLPFLYYVFILSYYILMRLIRFGYGFGYARILYALGPLLLLNIAVFGMTASLGYMKPAEEEITVYMETHASDKTPDYYVHFNTFVYSLDLIVPFELGQSSRWTPMTSDDKPLTKEPKDFISRQFSKIRCLQSYAERLPKFLHRIPILLSWFSVSAGWFSVIVVGAAFAGQFRRDSH